MYEYVRSSWGAAGLAVARGSRPVPTASGPLLREVAIGSSQPKTAMAFCASKRRSTRAQIMTVEVAEGNKFCPPPPDPTNPCFCDTGGVLLILDWYDMGSYPEARSDKLLVETTSMNLTSLMQVRSAFGKIWQRSGNRKPCRQVLVYRNQIIILPFQSIE